MSAAEPAGTMTVSVCLMPTEAEAVKQAARIAEMTNSAWAVSRVVAAMATRAAQIVTTHTARELGDDDVPKGARSARVSMVMRKADHEHLAAVASICGVTSHAFAQAALTEASKGELAAVPDSVRRLAGVSGTQKRKMGRLALSLPQQFASFDAEPLSKLFRDLVKATSDAAYNGNAPKINAGMSALIARHAEDQWVMVSVYADDMDVRVAAGMVRQTPQAFASAMAIKAWKEISK